MHAFDERATWIRRRIGDPSTISSLYLRGGTVFIVVAMVGSMLLTQRAASAPLAGAWTGVNDRLIEFGEEHQPLPAGRRRHAARSASSGSASVAQISPRLDQRRPRSRSPRRSRPSSQGQRWRAATYDTFALIGWAAGRQT